MVSLASEWQIKTNWMMDYSWYCYGQKLLLFKQDSLRLLVLASFESIILSTTMVFFKIPWLFHYRSKWDNYIGGYDYNTENLEPLYSFIWKTWQERCCRWGWYNFYLCLSNCYYPRYITNEWINLLCSWFTKPILLQVIVSNNFPLLPLYVSGIYFISGGRDSHLFASSASFILINSKSS